MFYKLRQFLFPPSPYAETDSFEESDSDLYVIWSGKTQTLAELEQVFTQHENLSQAAGKLWLLDNSIKSFTFRNNHFNELGKIVAVLRVDNQASDTANQIIASLCNGNDFTCSHYSVKHSVPLIWENKSKAASRSALISMSLFIRKTGMEAADFKQYWFGSHTPFALDIHPLCSYERHHVTACKNESMPQFDGIVPLGVESLNDLQFAQFFSANGKSALFNALRIQSDVENFLNLQQIVTLPMREFDLPLDSMA